MVEDRFPRETVEQEATVPTGEFFTPEPLRRERADAAFRDRIADIEDRMDALVVSHNDADGLTSGAFMRHWYESVTDGDAVVYPTTVGAPCNLPRALELLNGSDANPAWVFVTDLGPSRFAAARAELDRLPADIDVGWIDHHVWDDEQSMALRKRAHTALDDSRCATSLVVALRDGSHESSFPLPSDGVPERHRELAAVVNDHDLWVKDDPRSDRLAVFATRAPDEEYMDAALSGIGMLDRHADDIEAYERRDAALHERAVEVAERTRVAGLEVAFTYGDCPASAVGAELVEERGADLAVLLGPSGVVRLYGHSDGEGFTRCHQVARELGGSGGHTTAAGADLGFGTFSEYLTLWTEQEAAYRERIADAILEAT